MSDYFPPGEDVHATNATHASALSMKGITRRLARTATRMEGLVIWGFRLGSGYTRVSAFSFCSWVTCTTRLTKWFGTSSKWSKSMVKFPCPCVWLLRSVA